MTAKLVGALLVFTGCSGIGFSTAYQSQQEERLLRQTVLALDYMENQLQYQLTALPDLFRGAAQCGDGELSKVFLKLVAELEKQVYEDASGCMQAVLRQTRSLPLRVLRVLEQTAISLGAFDLPGQLNGLSAARKLCERELNALEQNRDERMRSYYTLGLCAGVALATLLF